MTLISRKPVTMPRFFDSYLLKDRLEWPERNSGTGNLSYPAVNIKETPQAFELVMAAPGMSKEDFAVEINKDLLTIASVEKEKKEKEEEEKFHIREFVPRSFKRSFKLPEDRINPEKIEASYANGLLTLFLPKKEEVKPEPKQIKVS